MTCGICKTRQAVRCCANRDCRVPLCADSNCFEDCSNCSEHKICNRCGTREDICDGCMAEMVAWGIGKDLERWRGEKTYC